MYWNYCISKIFEPPTYVPKLKQNVPIIGDISSLQ